MVFKERIVVDLIFNDINTCVQTVKEWFISKGYKKITARNPDRWSTAVILDIAKGGLMSKTTIQTTFKSHGGGNSIMIEYVGSNDGSGLSGKPASSMATDPKDKPYEVLAGELSRFIKATWKRGAGPGLTTPPTTAPSTMYQTSTPSYSSPVLQQTQQYGGYDQQQQYGTYQEQPQTGYDASGGYAQQSETTYQQEQPVVETPAAVEQPAPIAEPTMSDEEVARLEAELARQEAEEKAAQQAAPPVVAPEPEPVKVEPPVVEEPAYTAPPVAPAMPEPEVPPTPPVVEVPQPEPVAPEPVLEPKPEVAPIAPEPAPEAQPAPVQPVAAPTEALCPGCGKKTKPKWKTCPYCEYDLAGAKTAEPAAQPVAETPTEQTQPTMEQKQVSAGEVNATCPVCTGCGQPPAWIDDYKRYYCYACQKYI